MRVSAARAVLLASLIAGANMPVLAQVSPQSREQLLLQSGFISRSTNTPQAVAAARRELVPYRFEPRSSGEGRYYLFYDPDFCKCVFSGDEQAMKTYREKSSVVGSLPPTRPSVRGSSTAAEEIKIQMERGFTDIDSNTLFTLRF